MKNEILTKRQSNFELLRIVAMLMIVASHLACHGVQHVLDENIAYAAYNSGSLANKIFTSFLNPAGTAGVALFFMITGFFLCRKEKGSIKKVALEAAFYSVVLGIAFLITLAAEKILTGGGTVIQHFQTGIFALK